MFKKTFKKFLLCHDGTTTVDWIVLTAGMVLLAVTVALAVTTPSTATADKINTSLASSEPASL